MLLILPDAVADNVINTLKKKKENKGWQNLLKILAYKEVFHETDRYAVDLL